MQDARRAALRRTGRSLFRPVAFVLVAALALNGCASRTPATQAVEDPVDDLESPVEAIVDTVEATPRAPVIPATIDPTDPSSEYLRADLWDRIRAGFRFDLAQDNDRIAAQRNWYLRNQQYLDRVIARGSRYLHYIVAEAEARDMPLELALLPVVESAFDPYAYSVAHAAGPWQFIPSTGKFYNLKQTWWFDGRRDIVLSTRAALDFLEHLAARFDGDYYKALAAYNAGAGTVGRAVTRNIRAGKPTDYWSLKVPQETSAYVPKLVALAQIVQDPAKYGIRLNPIPDEPRFVTVDVGRQIDIARAAELADIPLAELYLYNPAHNRWLTDPEGPARLLVPVEVASAFRETLAGTPSEEFVLEARHEVAAGETLDSIAAQYNQAPEALRMVNGLGDEAPQPGTTLVIPQPRLQLASQDTSYEPRIVALNSGRGMAKYLGSPRSQPAKTITYTVRKGDTLSKVAHKHKVALRDLAKWNGMKTSKPLLVGQKLVIKPAGGASSATVASASKSRGGDKRVTHKVKRGDTLSSLARKFKVSVHDIARWNAFSPKRQLRIGESVKVYVD